MVLAAMLVMPSYAETSSRRVRVPHVHTLGASTWQSPMALTLTTRGATVATWTSGTSAVGHANSIRSSVRRPGRGWTKPRTIGHLPSRSGGLTSSAVPGGRAVVAWADLSGRALLRVWRPGHGWGRTQTVLGKGHTDEAPSLAYDRAAHVWAVGLGDQGPSGSTPRSVAVIHRPGATIRTVIGAEGRGCFVKVPQLAVDDDGDVAASWDSCVPRVGFLAADGTSWVNSDIDGCDSGCPRPQVLRSSTGFVMISTRFVVQNQVGHLVTTLYGSTPSGQWAAEAGDNPVVLHPASTDRAGDLVVCGRAGSAQVKPYGQPWYRMTLSGVRWANCAVDHGVIAVLGKLRTGSENQVVTFGKVGALSLGQPVAVRPKLRYNPGHPPVALSSSNWFTALSMMNRKAHGRPRPIKVVTVRVNA
jgi:hypothetical protein